MNIRDMTANDADAVLAIYAQGIATGHATFEHSPPDWAGSSGVSDRCVYDGVAEGTIYVSEAARGRGVGKALLSAFIAAAEDAGIWTLNAGVFVENDASIRLHEACGYRMVGTRKALGKMGFGPMAGKWRDVALMEYRSERVGVD